MLLLELDLVLRGRVLILGLESWLSRFILVLSGSSGGEGDPSLSELSSTEFLLSLLSLPWWLVVFLRKYLGRVLLCCLLLSSMSSLVTSDSSSSSSMLFLFFRSSLVALPYNILLITSEDDLLEPRGANDDLLSPDTQLWHLWFRLKIF